MYESEHPVIVFKIIKMYNEYESNELRNRQIINQSM